ncbi:MAG: hypothetical protein OXR82_18065 [Gammaproteobacteria bacterium]|nr:hypothetical protein [Gammaproteobacteria bacterium]
MMIVDHENIRLLYEPPTNADWVDDESDAIATLTFNQDHPVPVAEDVFSPFFATIQNREDLDDYQRSEQGRQQFKRVHFPYIERCAVHFERGNWDLFDRESPPVEQENASAQSRVISLYQAIQRGFSQFTLTAPAVRERIEQRIVFATTRRPDLVDELAELYVQSGRMLKLWKELSEIRRSFLDCYDDGLHLLVRVRYWKNELRDVNDVTLSVKQFDRFRQLYIDSFETLCRLLIIACAIEAIIHDDQITIRASKRRLSIDDFEKMQNRGLIYVSRRRRNPLLGRVIGT